MQVFTINTSIKEAGELEHNHDLFSGWGLDLNKAVRCKLKARATIGFECYAVIGPLSIRLVFNNEFVALASSG